MSHVQKITPFLWFENNAEEAAKYYLSIFNNAKILAITYYDEAGAKASGQPQGSVMTVAFQLEGQEFTAINGGPAPQGLQMSGAISFVINCENQDEIDHYWEKLSEGGEEGVCGWINHDKFGVTWQITPTILLNYLTDPAADKERARKAFAAMLTMKKLNIAELEKAYNA